MNTSSIRVIHFVKLIDKTDTFVCKNECASLKCPLSCDWVFMNTCCKTNSTCSFTGSIYYSVVYRFNILEELRLGSTWVTKQ